MPFTATGAPKHRAAAVPEPPGLATATAETDAVSGRYQAWIKGKQSGGDLKDSLRVRPTFRRVW